VDRVIEYALDLTQTATAEPGGTDQKMEALSRLAGGVAHDFNNLLAAILGFSEVAVAQLNVGHQARAAMNSIVEAGQRAAALTRQLLVFSRNADAHAQPLDLAAAVADSAKMLRRLLGDTVVLHWMRRMACRLVSADASQVSQLLLNLAVNAREAMPGGGNFYIRVLQRELTARCACLLDRAQLGPHVLLEASDTGEGVSTDVQGRMFEPLRACTVHPEHWLELASVYGVVRQHRVIST